MHGDDPLRAKFIAETFLTAPKRPEEVHRGRTRYGKTLNGAKRLRSPSAGFQRDAEGRGNGQSGRAQRAGCDRDTGGGVDGTGSSCPSG